MNGYLARFLQDKGLSCKILQDNHSWSTGALTHKAGKQIKRVLANDSAIPAKQIVCKWFDDECKTKQFLNDNLQTLPILQEKSWLAD